MTSTSFISMEDIDSALQSALRQDDGRGRVSLLRLEQTVLDFVQNSSAGWMEVGGAYNSAILYSSDQSTNSSACPTSTQTQPSSFHRLLVHRLADRFQIQRAPAQLLDGGIRLIKVKESKVPELLLVDWCSQQEATEGDRTNQGRSASPTKKNKVKIMKRSPSSSMNSSITNPSNHTGVSGANSLRKASSSRLEREKQYDEARARILGNTVEATLTDSTKEIYPKNTEITVPSSQLPAKAVYRRSREEELEEDPDFQRHTNILTVSAPAFTPASGYGDASEATNS